MTSRTPAEQMKMERAALQARPTGYSQQEIDAFAASRAPLKEFHWSELVLELESRGLKVTVDR